ncbi:rhomboid family intramembrane serine protease [Corynebacterium kroppenstedtii]|uniref:Putative membrane protein n=1 Tax=Corynebacterium kroppenstedtii (strain DSM 44385 / JCM 11950 / CIP 105744 / CCUG 35717) TaxID=645127 RepID=C4LGD9_CORK4|nr:rhomboid family intramembrane serine protease [Corynebacterium kroppenstedtii]ACR16835.1 putative membrane protein [Corynebacterium kroppenstedtii DSM 44385]QRP09867.1 rhomboid family intramembrane serine protease [Corynebacterium kroppenstedtii]
MLTRTIRQTPVTSGALIACIVVYLVTVVQSGSLDGNTHESSLAASWWLYLPALTPDNEALLRGLTFSFLHSGLTHLLFNGVMLWVFGVGIERTYGSLAMAIIFAGTSYGSAAMIQWRDPLSLTVGASGVIYGLMAVAAGMYLNNKPQMRALIVLIVVNLGYSLITPGISLWGHIGGLLTGALMAIAIYGAQIVTGVRGPGRRVGRFVAAGLGTAGMAHGVGSMSSGTSLLGGAGGAMMGAGGSQRRLIARLSASVAVFVVGCGAMVVYIAQVDSALGV